MERSGYFTFFVAAMLSNLRSRAAIPLPSLLITSLVLNGIITNVPVKAQVIPEVGGGGTGTITINVPQAGTHVCSPEQGTGGIRFGASLNPDGTIDTTIGGNFDLSSSFVASTDAGIEKTILFSFFVSL